MFFLCRVEHVFGCRQRPEVNLRCLPWLLRESLIDLRPDNLAKLSWPLNSSYGPISASFVLRLQICASILNLYC